MEHGRWFQLSKLVDIAFTSQLMSRNLMVQTFVMSKDWLSRIRRSIQINNCDKFLRARSSLDQVC